MSETERYLKEKYDRTKWPYYSLTKVIFDVGKNCKSELTELRKQGKIENCKITNGRDGIKIIKI